ncbi:MAG TPA: type IX secretion system sortase PorU, partial [Bacteroidales bacterium]
MKYSIITTVVLVVFSSINLSGQSTNLSGEIKWGSNTKIVDSQTSNEISILYFEGAVYNNPINHLPYYQDKVQLSSADEQVSVAFNNVYFEELTVTDSTLLSSFRNIKDTIIIHYSVASERKIPYLIYSFIPLRKNHVTGKIERLKLFSLRITKSGSLRELKSSAAALRFVDQSVLSSGDWYKFFVTKSGVYKISYNDLKNLGLTNPGNVRIYGNGGRMLPEVYSGNAPDDLKEIPIMMVTGSDGIFNDGDYILFYAEGPVTWSFNKTQNTYIAQKNEFIGDENSNTSRVSYFITSKPGGARIQADTAVISNPSLQVNTFDGLGYHEENMYNLLQSGQTWIGEAFDTQTTYSFSFSFPNLVTSEPVSLESGVWARADVFSYFTFIQNSQAFGAVGVSPVNLNNSLTVYAQPATYMGSFNASSDNVTLQMSYDKGSDGSGTGWLGYIKMIARERLSFYSPQFTFQDSRSIGAGNTALFSISNAPDNIMVWDVSDLNHVKQMSGSVQNNVFAFKARTDSLREFVAFDLKNGLYTPEFVTENNGKIDNQNLHSLKYADMVIISHPDFMEQAQRLANLHFQKEGLMSIIVTPDQIYNEFSSGMPHPAAIRNFMKMFYDRASSPDEVPKYLLLFGDGSYDNRFPYTKGSSNSNFIVTYEGINSLDPTNTFVSDDYFGLLDDNESIVMNPNSSSPYTNGLLDIGIGRIPVDSLSQAKQVVDKIEKYISHKSFGDWRNSICFVADDEDDNIHMEQADELATYVTDNYPTFNIGKI